jgi:type III pantothenate kinase
MLILIDIGNTNITIGFWDEKIQNVLRLKTCPDEQHIIHSIRDSISEHRMDKPENAIVCSVVPSATPRVTRSLTKGFRIKPVAVTHDMRFGLRFHVNNLRALGTDRIANAVAAHSFHKGHALVVDFGTATTFCFISSKGEYRSGPIMPGIGISADALAHKTARLPRALLKAPEMIFGNNSKNNILSGLVFGHAGAVERIIREMKRDLSRYGVIEGKEPVGIITTGGLAGLVTPYIRGIKKTNPCLTLEGLRIIYELNV